MAGASEKKQAQSNIKILKEIHIISLSINLLSLICLFYFKRPSAKKWYIMLSLPAFICQYVVEKTGRPKYIVKQGVSTLVSSGEDLKQTGLTEYMFDIIYVTLICDILMILFGSNGVWTIYLAIPGFAIYKFQGLLSSALAMFGIKMPSLSLNRSSKSGEISETKEDATPAKSKRQAKLEARGNKQKVRYR